VAVGRGEDGIETSVKTSVKTPGGTSMETSVATFPTPIGVCGIGWGPNGIRTVQLPEVSAAAARDRLRRTVAGTASDRAGSDGDTRLVAAPAAIQCVIGRIVAALGGVADDLADIEVDLDRTPEFARRVYQITRTVQPGQTTTYGEIAARLGLPGASRKVGWALGRNPVPLIVPCHRVLGASGKLGGFSAPGGVITKLRLLTIEGATRGGQPALF
jgi:methylated-DNA-[protein]-cysteine S-methyltransferase